MIEVSRSSRLICLIFLVLEIFLVKSSVKSVNERRKCTYRSLLIENSENEQLLANLFYPLQIDNFFRSVFELQPTIVQNRNPAFYSKLIDLNVIGQYLESQDLEFDGTFETARQESPEQHAGEGKSAIKVATARTRKHGVDWKLVKRVWRNGDWWCSSPNVDVIPLHVVRASFQSKGYSIVINKMQEFHHPLKVGQSLRYKFILRKLQWLSLLTSPHSF